MVRELVVASMQNLLAGDGLLRLHFTCASIDGEGGATFKPGYVHLLFFLLIDLTEINHWSVWHWRSAVVVLASDAKWFETVLVKLTESLALIWVKTRVFDDFVTEITWVVLKVTRFEGCILLGASSFSKTILMAFSVVIYDSL